MPSAEVGKERLFSNARDILGVERHCTDAETMRWPKGHYDKECQLKDM
jgi:hypothetical protein